MDVSNVKKIVLMASFPPRKAGMISAIKQLLPQCDDLYLWLNQYDEIPAELNQFNAKKLHITLSSVDLKDNGRYTFIRQHMDNVIFICDDDISWPNDYINYTLNILSKYDYNCIVSYFSSQIPKNIINFSGEVCGDVILNAKNLDKKKKALFGSGCCAFIPERIGWNISEKELNERLDVEIILTEHCLKNKIVVVFPQREKNFLVWQTGNAGKLLCIQKNSLSMNKKKNKRRIEKTQLYLKFKEYFLYAEDIH